MPSVLEQQFSFLTDGVTCLGNHVELFVFTYKNKVLFPVVKSLYVCGKALL